MANFRMTSLIFLTRKRTFSSTSATPSPSFTVRYLMESCGFCSKSALSVSRNLKLEEQDLKNSASVISFFRSHGFSNTHIANLIGNCPKILQWQVDENLKPKIEYMVGNGFSGNVLPELVTRNPSVLTQSLTSSTKPAVAFLMTFLKTNEKVVKAVKTSPWLLSSDLKHNMQPNINTLVNEGVPVDCVAKLISIQPKVLMLEFDRMASVVKTVKELGFQPTDPMLIHAVRVMLSMSESSWTKKVVIFQSFGWSEEEALSVFRRDPHCFAFSEEKLRTALDFHMSTVKLKPQVIIDCPKLLEYPIEKMRRKYNVLKILVEKNLVGEDTNFGRLLFLDENEFFIKYVTKHLDLVPILAEVYEMPK